MAAKSTTSTTPSVAKTPTTDTTPTPAVPGNDRGTYDPGVAQHGELGELSPEKREQLEVAKRGINPDPNLDFVSTLGEALGQQGVDQLSDWERNNRTSTNAETGEVTKKKMPAPEESKDSDSK